jgi:hypothetical protein
MSCRIKIRRLSGRRLSKKYPCLFRWEIVGAQNQEKEYYVMSKRVVMCTFIIILCLSVGFSCNSLGLIVKHKVSLKNEGTNNELSKGHLFINEQELPPFFELVIIENQIYRFVPGKNGSHECGYWPETQFQLPPIRTTEQIDNKEVERGWYFSDLDKKKEHTPGDWIWIKSGDIRAYVDVKKLPNFIRTQKAGLVNLERS